MGLFAPCNPALARFDLAYEPFQFIVGLGQPIDLVTDEEAPPKTAHDDLDVGDHLLISRIRFGLRPST